MNPTQSWKDFSLSYQQKSHPHDMWAQTLSQLELLEIRGDAALFACANTGVRSIAQNKQGELLATVSGIVGQEVTRVEFVIKSTGAKKREKDPTVSPLSILSYQPTFEDVARGSGLNPDCSFTNYAVSPCNHVAFAAAQVVVANRGKAYNPLFIWGGVGVGKSHLVQALGREILKKNPQLHVFFCPGEQFTNEIIEAIRTRTTEKFRNKYRKLDVLIVDDIQFLSGKNTVQEEFFHTFNNIVSNGGQVILVSDRPPHDISDIEDRLRSRFSGGLTVDISPPDFELRSAIALIKARERGFSLDMDAAQLIAQNSSDNRMLEGLLLSIYARALATSKTPTVPTITRDTVVQYLGQRSNGSYSDMRVSLPNPEHVIQAVCDAYHMRPLHLRQHNRSEEVAEARQVTMYILREYLDMNLKAIASFLKRKDHTTIIHGVAKIRQTLIHNTRLQARVDSIIQSLHLITPSPSSPTL